MEIIILLNEFERCAISQHDYTKSGDWQLGNAEIRKINDVYKKIREEGKIAQEQLLNLVDSNVPAVAVLAATYSMKFDPIRCLEVLKRLSLQSYSSHKFRGKVCDYELGK